VAVHLINAINHSPFPFKVRDGLVSPGAGTIRVRSASPNQYPRKVALLKRVYLDNAIRHFYKINKFADNIARVLYVRSGYFCSGLALQSLLKVS
jgi:hypothetical protein